MSTPDAPPTHLTKYAWLSIVAACLTIALKTGAWWVTGSVGLLADAAESVVNLVAAVIALYALKLAAKPADKNHHFGHTKAEYFSAAIEGQLIFIAAVFIMWTSAARFFAPQPLEDVGIGLLISIIAAILNGSVAWVLIKVGRSHRSSALVADGKHLLTDVWTSIGVVVGVAAVVLTGWNQLDAIVGFAVGINILVMGWKLLNDSASALLDHTWPKEENKELVELLQEFHQPGRVEFHGLRTRESGNRRFAEVHVLVPGDWSVQRGHDIVEHIEEQIAARFDRTTLVSHIEPLEDPRSYGDFETEIEVPESTPKNQD